MRERENLTEVAKFRKHRLYGWEDISMIPTSRYLALLYHAHDADRTVCHSDLERYIELTRESFNSGQTARLGALIETLAVHLDSYMPDKVNFKMANCLILVDDEPVDEMTKYHERIKASIYDVPEMRAFFLRMLLKRLQMFGLLPDTMRTAQAQVDQVHRMDRDGNESAFSTLIGMPTYVDYLTA